MERDSVSVFHTHRGKKNSEYSAPVTDPFTAELAFCMSRECRIRICVLGTQGGCLKSDGGAVIRCFLSVSVGYSV